MDKVNLLYAGMGNPEKLKAVADSLSPNEKATIIEYLNQQVKIAGHNPSEAEDLLVNLGDDVAIAREVGAFPFESTGGGTFLLSTIQPKVVPALAPYMLVNEQTAFNEEGGPTKSFFSAEGIRELLERSTYFSSEVNRWAASWYGKGGKGADPPYEFREMMRNWWSANQQYFETGNYAAVQPGSPPPEAPARLHEATPPPIDHSVPFRQEGKTAEPLPTPSTISASSTESGWPLISSLLVLALTVGGMLVFLKMKR